MDDLPPTTFKVDLDDATARELFAQSAAAKCEPRRILNEIVRDSLAALREQNLQIVIPPAESSTAVH